MLSIILINTREKNNKRKQSQLLLFKSQFKAFKGLLKCVENTATHTHTLCGGGVLIRDAIGFSSLLSPLHALPQICHFASIVGCFVRSAVAWAVPKQCCGAIEKIIGFSLKQFYADAIEPVCGVKVRAILGPIQMRTGQYTLRQMSKPISSFRLTGGSVCVWHRGLCTLLLRGTNEKVSWALNKLQLHK